MRKLNQKFTSSTLLGAYVPLTMDGKIMVNGVLASCYPSTNHDVGHFGMAPMRWFPTFTEWIFGDDNGMQAYVSILADIGIWILPYVEK